MIKTMNLELYSNGGVISKEKYPTRETPSKK